MGWCANICSDTSVSETSSVSVSKSSGTITWVNGGRFSTARITSYNVCYTKLLRVLAVFFMLWSLGVVTLRRILRIRRKSDLGFVSAHLGLWIILFAGTMGAPDVLQFRMQLKLNEPTNRITSYNVCYTKLLRVFAGFFIALRRLRNF